MNTWEKRFTCPSADAYQEHSFVDESCARCIAGKDLSHTHAHTYWAQGTYMNIAPGIFSSKTVPEDRQIKPFHFLPLNRVTYVWVLQSAAYPWILAFLSGRTLRARLTLFMAVHHPTCCKIFEICFFKAPIILLFTSEGGLTKVSRGCIQSNWPWIKKKTQTGTAGFGNMFPFN